MSNKILKDQRVVNLVVSILVGNHAINNYTAQNGNWLDGKLADVLFIPTTTISELLPPVLVEVQNVVDKLYMHRLNKYCNKIYDEYNMEPIALTICIKDTWIEICNISSNSPKASYLKQLPSHFWAKEHLIMTPTTIRDYIDDHSNDNNTNNTDSEINNENDLDDNNDSNNENDLDDNNDSNNENDLDDNNDSNNENDLDDNNDSNNENDLDDNNNSNNNNISSENNTNINKEPLPPLVALGYVFMEQESSLFGLHFKEDPTVVLLDQIAKEALDHHIQDHQSTVDRLLDVTTETQKQFKRIIEVANEDEPNLKKIRSLASAGVLYTETCLHKYQWQDSNDSDMMPIPLDLPSNVQSPKRSMHVDNFPSITSRAHLADMNYARAFKNEYLKTHKQMNWQVCYAKGLAEGYFTKYKNYRTLKNTFNEFSK